MKIELELSDYEFICLCASVKMFRYMNYNNSNKDTCLAIKNIGDKLNSIRLKNKSLA